MFDCSADAAERTQRLASAAIDRALQAERRDAPPSRLLVFGSARSGRSTLCSALRLLLAQPELLSAGGAAPVTAVLAPVDAAALRPQLAAHVLRASRALIAAVAALGLELAPATAAAAERVLACTALSTDVAVAVSTLWADEAVRHAASAPRRLAFPDVGDSAPYLLSHVARLAAPDLVPTVEDLLRVHNTSAAMAVERGAVGGMHFEVIDLGHQESARVRWLPHVAGVGGLIFCAALTEYAEPDPAWPGTVRIRRTLELWEAVVNSAALQCTPIYLFLTKVDVFRELIQLVPLTTVYPHFAVRDGADLVEAAKEFLRHRFLELLVNPRPVHVHFSCPVDFLNARLTLEVTLKSLVMAEIA